MIKRKTILFILSSFFCVTAVSQNTWDKRESVGGSKRERAVGFAIGNRGYVCLGQDTLNQMLNDLWEFDPGTNSWTQKATFPGAARRDAAAFVIGNKAYVGTGINNADAFAGTRLSDLWEYDPSNNVWTSKAPYPGNSGTGIYYTSGFSVSGKGYFCCGKKGSSFYSNELWEYNPLSNSWAMKAAFPGGVRYGGVAFSIGNFGYYGTGTDENVFTQDFYKYNPVTNTWTMIAPLPGTGRFACSSFTLANRGYIIFGTDGGYKDELWEYDPQLNYWASKTSYPDGERRSGVAFTAGSKAYAGTGKGLTGTRRDFYEYTVAPVIGIQELNNDLITSVYPNPVNESCIVKFSNDMLFSREHLSWQLLNIEGKIMAAENIISNEISIHRNGLSPGMYFLVIRADNNSIASKKLIMN